MPDPLEDLVLPTVPLAPNPAFTADLRRRIVAALRLDELDPSSHPGGTMTDIETTAGHVPKRLHTITPYLCCRHARQAIDWYGDVFGAELTSEIIAMGDDEEGRRQVGHAELKIGDSVFMISDEWPAGGVVSPLGQEGSSIGFVLYVPEVDAVVAAAIAAGATEVRPVAEQYGSRSGWVLDPFGYRWNIATAL